MNNADRAPFAELLAAVYELYGKVGQLSETILSMWWEAMSRYDLEAVRGALSAHAMNPDSGQFLPKPADVVRELDGTTVDASMLAWQKAVRAIGTVGSYASVVFDDPITNRVLADLGGWPWFGRQSDKEMPFVEKRFRDAYRALLRRGLAGSEPILRLPGIIESQNHGNGYAVEKPIMIGNKARALAISEGRTKSLSFEEESS